MPSSSSAASNNKIAELAPPQLNSSNPQLQGVETIENQDQNKYAYNARSGKMERLQEDGHLPPATTVSLIDIMSFGDEMKSKEDYFHLQVKLHKEYEAIQREKQEKLTAKHAAKQ